MSSYGIKIPMADWECVFFNFLGPELDLVSPWQSRKEEIYQNASKKYMRFQNNDNKEVLFQIR